jgi:TAT (twin-arginine translocation) pathway signal sequence
MFKTRRAFLKTAAAASAAVALPLPAQTPPPATTPTPTPGPDKKPDSLAKLARDRYGKFLAPEELPLLDEDMAALERRSGRLRGYKLTNADEPAVDFSATRP